MRDWETLVEHLLAGLALEPAERAEVIAELAAHLEEACEELRRQGMAEHEALARTLSQVEDWQDLRRRIIEAKRRAYPMKKRAQQLWIPGFFTLIVSILLLALFQRFQFQPRLINGGFLLFVPWLLSLPLAGALAAYVSSRAGGSLGTALLASVFPVVVLTTGFLLMFPIGFLIERVIGRHNDFAIVATTLLTDAIGWILVPGVALLAGGVVMTLLLSQLSSSQASASRSVSH